MTVCWAADEAAARRTALELCPTGALPGEQRQELPPPAHFGQAAELVTEEAIAEAVVCGPDPERHAAKIQEYADAGFDHVNVHQVGPEQAGFLDLYRRQVLRRFGSAHRCRSLHLEFVVPGSSGATGENVKACGAAVDPPSRRRSASSATGVGTRGATAWERRRVVPGHGRLGSARGRRLA